MFSFCVYWCLNDFECFWMYFMAFHGACPLDLRYQKSQHLPFNDTSAQRRLQKHLSAVERCSKVRLARIDTAKRRMLTYVHHLVSVILVHPVDMHLNLQTRES